MRPSRLTRPLYLVVALLAPAPASTAGATSTSPEGTTSELRVQVTGVRSTEGHVRVDICSADLFLKDDCRYSAEAPATPGMTTVIVRDVPPGVYAAQAYHDRNDNHVVDRNVFGMPTEAIGFSNDAPVRFRPPSFKAAAFSYAGGAQTITLKLRGIFH